MSTFDTEYISNLELPGRLGDQEMTVESDPRTDPRCLVAMTNVNMELPVFPTGCPVSKKTSPYSNEGCRNVDDPQGLLEWLAESEIQLAKLMNEGMLKGLDPIECEGILRKQVTIEGLPDGNDLMLYIASPPGEGPFPCLFHCHCGGMSILSANEPIFARLRDEVASRGAVIVMPEFRNAGGKLGPYPFPAGLSDCGEGLKWCLQNKANLNVFSIIISGVSGGGNLALATTLKAKLEAGILPDGCYACCPFISNLWSEEERQSEDARPLISLVENEKMVLDNDAMGAVSAIYTPHVQDQRNPIAWPFWASVEDLIGFPPTVISVNELDPLRDEGLAFSRLLRLAHVSGHSRIVVGTTHASDMFAFNTMQDVCHATIDDMISFAKGFGGKKQQPLCQWTTEAPAAA